MQKTRIYWVAIISCIMISYPITLTFKLLAFSPELAVTDQQNQTLLYVKQKTFTLREETTVFADQSKTTPVYKFKADKVIGFGATHHITRTSDASVVGAVKADGWRSLWRTRYTVTDKNNQIVFRIKEENPWIKVLDYLVDEIPYVGWMFSTFINPRYVLVDETGVLRYRVTKKRSFVERRFILEQVSAETNQDQDERLVALALIQFVMLERHRG